MTQAEVIRKTIIRMALRRQHPGAGSAPAFLRQRTADTQWPNLRRVLGDVPCAVVGAVATRHYMPERATRSLDVVVSGCDAAAARQRLQAAGWTCEGRLNTARSSWRSPDGACLDLIQGAEGWWPAAIAEAQSNQDLQGLAILPFQYLVLMKFRSGRAQDVADVTRMLGQAAPEQLNATRELFRSEEPAGLEDLESLIYLGQLEMQ